MSQGDVLFFSRWAEEPGIQIAFEVTEFGFVKVSILDCSNPSFFNPIASASMAGFRFKQFIEQANNFIKLEQTKETT